MKMLKMFAGVVVLFAVEILGVTLVEFPSVVGFATNQHGHWVLVTDELAAMATIAEPLGWVLIALSATSALLILKLYYDMVKSL